MVLHSLSVAIDAAIAIGVPVALTLTLAAWRTVVLPL